MAEIIEMLEKLNPWWTGKNFNHGIIRNEYLNSIKSFLKTGEIIVITGVRRAGKTTLIYQTIKHLLDSNVEGKQILFASFDNADISSLKNPIYEVLESFFNEIADRNKKCYIFFDEIQSVIEWERYARTIYDERKHNLVISGSSSYLLSNNLAKLLSGRYLKIEVYPLSFKEFLFFKGVGIKTKLDVFSKKEQIIKLLNIYLAEGGYPRIALEKEEALKGEFLKNYFESIVLNDIILMNNVRQEKLMNELIYYLATNFTQLYSYKNLSEFLSADFSTIREYLGYIENSNLFFSVPIFSYSLKTQNRNNKKIYFIDNGLRNFISFKFSKDYGKLAENLVFVELMRKNKEVYYWQDNFGNEVDFIIKNKDNSLSAINVTYTDEIDRGELEIFKKLKKEYKKSKNYVILTKTLEKTEDGIKFIPLWKWLMEQ